MPGREEPAGTHETKLDQSTGEVLFAIGCRHGRPYVDSGSVVSTCPVDYATSVPTEKVNYSLKLITSRGPLDEPWRVSNQSASVCTFKTSSVCTSNMSTCVHEHMWTCCPYTHDKSFNPIPEHNERFARQYRYELHQSFQAAFTIFEVLTLSSHSNHLQDHGISTSTSTSSSTSRSTSTYKVTTVTCHNGKPYNRSET